MFSSTRRSRIAVFVASTGALCASNANAALLTAIEDNNVHRNAPTTVQGGGNGSSSTFVIKHASTSQTNARIGYVKFNLSSLTAADGDDATFTVTLASTTTTTYTLRAFALKSGAANYNWSESAITYENRPAYSELNTLHLLNSADVTAVGGAPFLESGVASGTPVSFSFSGLSAFKQTDDTVTFILLNSTQGNGEPSLSISSSEGAAPPTLTVVPEPGVVSLLGIGVVGLLARRRSR